VTTGDDTVRRRFCGADLQALYRSEVSLYWYWSISTVEGHGTVSCEDDFVLALCRSWNSYLTGSVQTGLAEHCTFRILVTRPFI